MNIILQITFIISLLYTAISKSQAELDLVEHFPGYGKYDYDIYSGMIDVDQQGLRQLHYVYVESQNNPKTDPLLLWFNGGPGASSLLGLSQENGPFIFKDINKFMTPNPYAWNLKANVLYLEGPPGVGFSVNKDPNYKYSDDNTAQDFLQALIGFRERFKGIVNFQKPMFISGESFAGMYIPFLTKAILDYNDQQTIENNKFPLKGFLIGNGIMIMNFDLMNISLTNFYVENHFFSRDLRKLFYDNCPQNQESYQCLQFMKAFDNVSNNTNVLDIYNYTYTYQSNGQQDMEKSEKYQNDFLQKFINKFSSTPNPTPDSILQGYYNNPEVQDALHVPHKLWVGDSEEIFNQYPLVGNSTVLYKQFFEAGLRIMIYSGNVDADVPIQYTQDCLKDMMENPVYQNKFTKNGPYRQWITEDDQQVAGMVQYYTTQTGSEFIYTMVRNAGHLVPTFQPKSAFQMLDRFMNNQQL